MNVYFSSNELKNIFWTLFAMGVKHLETFMKFDVPNGFPQISIVEECQEHQR